jgi:hypothetical protein
VCACVCVCVCGVCAFFRVCDHYTSFSDNKDPSQAHRRNIYTHPLLQRGWRGRKQVPVPIPSTRKSIVFTHKTLPPEMSTRKRLTAQITHRKHAQGAMPPTWYNRPTPGLCRPAPFPHTVVETRCREQGGGYHETFIGSARAEMKVDYSETRSKTPIDCFVCVPLCFLSVLVFVLFLPVHHRLLTVI